VRKEQHTSDKSQTVTEKRRMAGYRSRNVHVHITAVNVFLADSMKPSELGLTTILPKI